MPRPYPQPHFCTTEGLSTRSQRTSQRVAMCLLGEALPRSPVLQALLVLRFDAFDLAAAEEDTQRRRFRIHDGEDGRTSSAWVSHQARLPPCRPGGTSRL